MRSPHDLRSVSSPQPAPSPRSAWRSPSRLDADTTVRLRDVASLQGAAPAPLIGYGLVVGLNKTGDRRQTIFSAQTLANMLERFGVAGAGRGDQDRERRGGAGDRGAAGVLAPRQPPRRHRVVDRRRAQPAGRHAAADAAARHRRHRSTRWRRARCRSAASAAARAATRCRSTTSPSAACRPAASSRPSSPAPCRRRPRRSCCRSATPDFTTATRVADAINAELGAGRGAGARRRPASRCRCRRTTGARCRT